MPQTRECDYCGADIEPGTGTMFVRTNGTTIHFCSSKCEKNADLGREARDLSWTEAGRGTAGEAVETEPDDEPAESTEAVESEDGDEAKAESDDEEEEPADDTDADEADASADEADTEEADAEEPTEADA